jgi:hypothetical protein
VHRTVVAKRVRSVISGLRTTVRKDRIVQWTESRNQLVCHDIRIGYIIQARTILVQAPRRHMWHRGV